MGLFDKLLGDSGEPEQKPDLFLDFDTRVGSSIVVIDNGPSYFETAKFIIYQCPICGYKVNPGNVHDYNIFSRDGLEIDKEKWNTVCQHCTAILNIDEEGHIKAVVGAEIADKYSNNENYTPPSIVQTASMKWKKRKKSIENHLQLWDTHVQNVVIML